MIMKEMTVIFYEALCLSSCDADTAPSTGIFRDPFVRPWLIMRQLLLLWLVKCGNYVDAIVVVWVQVIIGVFYLVSTHRQLSSFTGYYTITNFEPFTVLAI